MYEIANEFFQNINQPIRFFDVNGESHVEYDGGRHRYAINFVRHYGDIEIMQTADLIDVGYEMIAMVNRTFGGEL